MAECYKLVEERKSILPWKWGKDINAKLKELDTKINDLGTELRVRATSPNMTMITDITSLL